MEYQILEETPIKRKIEINVSPEEVDAQIAGVVALHSKEVEIDGFRKGKVPPNVIEKRFHDSIYNEAKENLINVNLNELMQKLAVETVGGIIINGDDQALEKGKNYEYTVEFEVFPEFDLPKYEGLEVEEEKAVMDEKELELVRRHMLESEAKVSPVSGNAPPKDGQIATIDFQVYDGDKLLEDFQASNFDLELGKNSALPEFETLLKGIPVGHTGEGEIEFPKDFIEQSLAGRTLRMKATVHAVKEKKYPELDDALAKKLGFKDAEVLKDLLSKSYMATVEKMNRGVAERNLLDQMLKQVDFPLPPKMVELETRFLLGEKAEKLERQGKNLKSMGKSLEELLEMEKPEAEDLVRIQILLRAIAKKENLEITPQEVQKEVLRHSIRDGVDFRTNLEKLEESGLLGRLMEQMLCDKAMDLVYAKANVTMVEPGDAKPEDSTKSQTEKVAG